MSQRSHQWRWDETIRRNYYLAERNGRIIRVFEDNSWVPDISNNTNNPQYVGDMVSAFYFTLSHGWPELFPRIVLSVADSQDRQPRSLQQQQQNIPLTLPHPSNAPSYGQSNYRYQLGPEPEPRNSPVSPSSPQTQRPQLSYTRRTSSSLPQIHTGKDKNGTESRTINGPHPAITDRFLSSQGVYAHKKLLATDGDEEKLDPTFRKRPKGFFKIGRVFLTLWSEPTSSQDRSTEITTVRFGERAYTKVRRFIVVRENELHCTTIPVWTYGGRGISKPGLVKCEHAIPYTGTIPPQPLPEERPKSGEQGMQAPVRIIPDLPGDLLDNMSRIHYGRLYTVEANLKVKPFGMVAAPSLLMPQVLQAWGVVPTPALVRSVSGPGVGSGRLPDVHTSRRASSGQDKSLGQICPPQNAANRDDSSFAPLPLQLTYEEREIQELRRLAQDKQAADREAARRRRTETPQGGRRNAINTARIGEVTTQPSALRPPTTNLAIGSIARTAANQASSLPPITNTEAAGVAYEYETILRQGRGQQQALQHVITTLQHTHHTSRDAAAARAAVLLRYAAAHPNRGSQQR